MDCYLKAQGGTVSLCFRFKNKERHYAKRDSVTDFTDGSRRRMLKYLRSCRARYRIIGTLTYPAEYDARAFRSHWRAFVERWRRTYGDLRGASLFWFVEYQSNGQPHFHFYTTHYIEHGWLASSWYSICKTGNIQHASAGVSIEGFRKRGAHISYAAKYAGKKGEQKTLPDLYKNQAGRWWGVVGDRECVSASIKVDSDEYYAFELFSLVEMVKKMANKPVFDEYGATVWQINDKHLFGLVLWGFKRAKKMLLQAEQNREAEFYRKRRG